MSHYNQWINTFLFIWMFDKFLLPITFYLNHVLYFVSSNHVLKISIWIIMYKIITFNKCPFGRNVSNLLLFLSNDLQNIISVFFVNIPSVSVLIQIIKCSEFLILIVKFLICRIVQNLIWLMIEFLIMTTDLLL